MDDLEWRDSPELVASRRDEFARLYNIRYWSRIALHVAIVTSAVWAAVCLAVWWYVPDFPFQWRIYPLVIVTFSLAFPAQSYLLGRFADAERYRVTSWGATTSRGAKLRWHDVQSVVLQRVDGPPAHSVVWLSGRWGRQVTIVLPTGTAESQVLQRIQSHLPGRVLTPDPKLPDRGFHPMALPNYIAVIICAGGVVWGIVVGAACAYLAAATLLRVDRALWVLGAVILLGPGTIVAFQLWRLHDVPGREATLVGVTSNMFAALIASIIFFAALVSRDHRNAVTSSRHSLRHPGNGITGVWPNKPLHRTAAVIPFSRSEGRVSAAAGEGQRSAATI